MIEEPEAGREVSDLIEQLRDVVSAASRRALRDREASSEAPPPPASPTMARFYETTCIDIPGSGAGVHVMSIPLPPRLFAAWQSEDAREFIGTSAIGGELNLRDQRDIDSELLIPAILYTRPDRCPTYSGALHSRESEFQPEEFVLNTLPHFSDFVRSSDPALYLFATRIAVEPVVPVEGSPLRAMSLAKLVGSSGASATLALAGIHDPLLLVVTPVAVVIMGAATGVASGLHKGFEEGLHRRVVRWLTGTDPGGEADDSPQP